ncbi:hypothetical protein N7456_012283 [Penicillium angulare]|uniref:Uncharacterized protein n=1 Tax=Penicillium angulare TaxID=116970 RepID=A0A9W9K1I9_9EURO|nr:hypothetical protein N7456_012283 [Penicillium angulare]
MAVRFQHRMFIVVFQSQPSLSYLFNCSTSLTMKNTEQTKSPTSRIPRFAGNSSPLPINMAQQNRSPHGPSPLNTTEATTDSLVPRAIQPVHLPPISERNSTDTNHDTETPLRNELPTLRIASSAERFIMGDEASSIPLLSRRQEMRSDGVFYPRTVRNASPLSEVSTSTNTRTPSHLNPHSNTMISDSQSVNFLDICRSHPELEGTVIQTNVVKAPEPRMTRVMGNLRNAFTRGRPDKKSVSSPLFEIVNQRPSITRPLAPPSQLATMDPTSSMPSSPIGTSVRPSRRASNQQIRQEIREVQAAGMESVCRTLNALGRRLVEDDDINRRRVWYREFVQLSNLLADFNSRDARIGEAASHVSQMRAEASLRRYAMLLQVHQALQDNDALEATIQSVDLPTDRIVEEWDH